MRGKKGLTAGKWVVREEESVFQGWKLLIASNEIIVSYNLPLISDGHRRLSLTICSWMSQPFVCFRSSSLAATPSNCRVGGLYFIPSLSTIQSFPLNRSELDFAVGVWQVYFTFRLWLRNDFAAQSMTSSTATMKKQCSFVTIIFNPSDTDQGLVLNMLIANCIYKK